MGGLKQVLPILAFAASCHGAALPETENLDMETVMDLVQEFIANPDPYMEAFGVRAKRHVEDIDRSGFKQFPMPFIGAEVGIKYADPSNRAKGGEAYLEIQDLQSLVLHAKFEGGSSSTDGLFEMDLDYHFEHKDGSGVEEGSMEGKREKKGGMWKTEIETEAHPFSGTPIIARGGVTSTIEGTLNRSGQDMDIIIKADIRGVKYDGKISVKSASDKTNVVVDIKKGSESVVQLKSEVQVKGTKFRLRSKYSIMGGKVAQGDFKANYQNNKLTFEAPPYKLEVELHLGRSIKVEASKNGESMWTYETLREDKSNPNAIVWEANSKIFIDRHNRNFLLRKFKINFDVVKDGSKVID